MNKTAAFEKAWKGFNPGPWQQVIEVRDFIHRNVTPYEGDESFLVGPTPRTQTLNQKFQELLRQEAQHGGVLDVNVKVVSSRLTYEPGYLDQACGGFRLERYTGTLLYWEELKISFSPARKSAQ